MRALLRVAYRKCFGGGTLYAALLIYGPFYSADGRRVRNLARWVYLYGRGREEGGDLIDRWG